MSDCLAPATSCKRDDERKRSTDRADEVARARLDGIGIIGYRVRTTLGNESLHTRRVERAAASIAQQTPLEIDH